MGMSVNFYNNSSPEEVVSKTKTLLATYDCDIWDDNDISKPVFLLPGTTDLKNCNYCYVSSYGRYYSCTPILQGDGNYLIYCNTDVVSSFFNDAKTNTDVIANRSSNKYNKDIQDNEILALPTEEYRDINMNGTGHTSSKFTGSNSDEGSVILTLKGRPVDWRPSNN